MNRKTAFGLLAGALATGCVALLDRTGLVGRWENPMGDWRARLLARPAAATDEVRLVLLDQYSLDWGSREMQFEWPWPRETYAFAVDFLGRQGAKAAIFDVLFTEPSRYAEADAMLGEAAGRFGRFVGAVFLGTTAGQADRWPEGAKPSRIRIEGLKEWLAAHPEAAADLVSPGAAFPISELAGQAAWLANVRETPDGDGVFRRAAPFRIFDGQVLPSLGFAGWLAGLGKEEVVARMEGDLLVVEGRRIPLDASGRMIVKFRGKTGTHRAYNAAEVIQSEMRLKFGDGEPPLKDGEAFAGKHAVFGFSAPGLKDLRTTPMGGDYPGPEVYATMLDNLLEGDFLRDAPAAAVWLWILGLALAAGAAAATARSGWQSGLAAAALIPLPTLAGLAAWEAGIVLPVAGASAGAVAGLLGGAVVNFVLEGRQKMFIKGAFKHYLSGEVIEQILRDPGSLKLGGERRELTIFFSDLQGFSTISEKLGPEDLTKLLNDYLTDMTDIILEEGGTLDKYEGDAIIAFWNAPLQQADHATRAVRASVRCQKKLAERRDEFEKRTGAVLKMRIGLNTGAVVVGNMGSSNRFDYTVLGDAANLASRLEGANKALGTYLMIAETTWAQTKGAFPGRELGQLRVVGRKTPVKVYEATGLEGEAAGEREKAFGAALEQAKARRWAEAAAAFGALGGDAAAEKYAGKCRELAESGGDWDGIWNLTEK